MYNGMKVNFGSSYLVMKTYRVKKYFIWGEFKLEPLEHLEIHESKQENCYSVVRQKTKESMLINKKAFANYLAIDLFEEL